jgi:hypothetical protein
MFLWVTKKLVFFINLLQYVQPHAPFTVTSAGFGLTSLIPDVVRNWSLLKGRLKGCFVERVNEL